MLHRPTFRITLLAAALASLAACGGGDDDPEEMSPEGEQTTPDPGEQPGDADPGETDPGGEQEEAPVTGIDLTDPNPRVFLAECGALPVQETAFSTSIGAPATFAEGQIVAGALADDTAHYWQVELQEGYHHIVVDDAELTGRSINLGLTVADLAGSTTPGAGVDLVDGSESGFDTRLVAFFENETARTVTFELTPNFLGENYTFGVFANGREIPSPRFDDCPDITPLNLGEAQVAQITEADSADDRAWYGAELEAGTYTVDATATRIDGEPSNIIYDLVVIDGFGQGTAEETVLGVSEVDSASTASGTFTRAGAGPVWFRVGADNPGLAVEFTVNAAGG